MEKAENTEREEVSERARESESCGAPEARTTCVHY